MDKTRGLPRNRGVSMFPGDGGGWDAFGTKYLLEDALGGCDVPVVHVAGRTVNVALVALCKNLERRGRKG